MLYIVPLQLGRLLVFSIAFYRWRAYVLSWVPRGTFKIAAVIKAKVYPWFNIIYYITGNRFCVMCTTAKRNMSSGSGGQSAETENTNYPEDNKPWTPERPHGSDHWPRHWEPKCVGLVGAKWELEKPGFYASSNVMVANTSMRSQLSKGDPPEHVTAAQKRQVWSPHSGWPTWRKSHHITPLSISKLINKWHVVVALHVPLKLTSVKGSSQGSL